MRNPLSRKPKAADEQPTVVGPAMSPEPAPHQPIAAAAPAPATAPAPEQPTAVLPDPSAVPAGADPVDLAGRKPSFRDRGRMRRRLRYLRRVRELGFRDLGGLVFDLHRFGRQGDHLVRGKLAALGAVDGELRALERALDDRRDVLELREPGIAACPRCGALHGSDARFCPSCGTPLAGPRAFSEVAGPGPSAVGQIGAVEPAAPAAPGAVAAGAWQPEVQPTQVVRPDAGVAGRIDAATGGPDAAAPAPAGADEQGVAGEVPAEAPPAEDPAPAQDPPAEEPAPAEEPPAEDLPAAEQPTQQLPAVEADPVEHRQGS